MTSFTVIEGEGIFLLYEWKTTTDKDRNTLKRVLFSLLGVLLSYFRAYWSWRIRKLFFTFSTMNFSLYIPPPVSLRSVLLLHAILIASEPFSMFVTLM